jgi:hypothetical protein
MQSKLSKVNHNTQQSCVLLQVTATFDARDRASLRKPRSLTQRCLFKKTVIP